MLWFPRLRCADVEHCGGRGGLRVGEVKCAFNQNSPLFPRMKQSPYLFFNCPSTYSSVCSIAMFINPSKHANIPRYVTPEFNCTMTGFPSTCLRKSDGDFFVGAALATAAADDATTVVVAVAVAVAVADELDSSIAILKYVYMRPRLNSRLPFAVVPCSVSRVAVAAVSRSSFVGGRRR